MLMDGLALVVVLGVNQTIRTGKGLRRLIGFEAQIAFLIFVRLIGISQTAITQHEIVVCLQILGIDGHGDAAEAAVGGFEIEVDADSDLPGGATIDSGAEIGADELVDVDPTA